MVAIRRTYAGKCTRRWKLKSTIMTTNFYACKNEISSKCATNQLLLMREQYDGMCCGNFCNCRRSCWFRLQCNGVHARLLVMSALLELPSQALGTSAFGGSQVITLTLVARGRLGSPTKPYG